MAFINIKSQKDQGDYWLYEVEVSDFGERKNYEVTLKKDYFKKLLGKGRKKPENLIQKSFEFLLDRESMQSIFSKLDIAKISDYFQEFEEEIRKNLWLK